MKRVIIVLLILAILIPFTGCRKKDPREKLQAVDLKMRKRDFIGARIDLKEFLKKHAEDPLALDARFMLAQCYLAEKDFTQAREHFYYIYKKIGPEDRRGQVAIEFILSTYRMEGKFAQGIEEARKLTTQLSPESDFASHVNLLISDLLVDDKRTTEAINFLNQLIEKGKDHRQRTAALERLVSIHAGKGDLDNAIQAYGDYAEGYPDYQDINDLIAGQAYFYRRKGDQEKAGELFQKAIDGYQQMIDKTLDRSQKADLIFRQAKTYELQEDFPSAREKYENILKDFSDTPTRQYALIAKGDSYYREGNLEKAMTYFQELLKTESKNPWIVRTVRQRIANLIREKSMTSSLSGATTVTKGQKPPPARPKTR